MKDPKSKINHDIIKVFLELKNVKFSYIAIYFVSLALVYKYAYYNTFNIDITTFISISDLYTFFVDLFPGLLYFFIVLFLLTTVFIGSAGVFVTIIKALNNNKTKTEVDKDQEIVSEKGGPLKVLTITNLGMFILFYVFITIRAFPFSITADGTRSLYDSTSLFFRLILTILLLSGFIISMLSTSYLDVSLSKTNVTIIKVKLMFFGIFIFYLTGISATLNAGFKIRFYPTKVIEFTYNKKNISSYEDNIVYVGSTSNYIFLFYKDKAITKTFKISEVKDLNFFNRMHYDYQKDQLEDISNVLEEGEIENHYELIDSIFKDLEILNSPKKDSILIKVLKIKRDSSLSEKDKYNKLLDIKSCL
ncbi:hypothetical protein ACFO3O_11740 [Dokdonia ponticola]|uniref:Uncharacterized protein n=1 Tax=Dokdonia ponticola TaxID=2041041 RepID=A0ABV9HYM4_9FLAO